MDIQTISHTQTRKPAHTYEAPINKRGTIVIPKDLREKMNIRPDDRIRFQVYEDVVEIESVKPLRLEEVFGSVEPLQSEQDLEEVIREAKEEHYLDRFDRKHHS